MAVAIRLQRKGATKRAYYKIVVLDKEAKRDGAFLEILGDYHPKNVDESKKLFINLERMNHWISKGAKVSESVQSLINASK